MTISREDVGTAVAVVITMFAIFNANGREIGSYDSQPTKLAARELLLRHTLALNYAVGSAPQLAERPGFQLARDGTYRSAYSPIPSIAAAGTFWPLEKAGLVDVRAPLAPSLMSAVTSSGLVSLSVALMFLTARLHLSRRQALVLAGTIGLGTGLWSTASQTLWQHETAILGLSAAVFCLTVSARPSNGRTGRPGWAVVAGLSLGLAAAARLQLAPAVCLLLVGLGAVSGWRSVVLAAIAAALIIVPTCATNARWFGSVLGAAPMLEALHESVHAATGSFSVRSGGFTGLLFSPNRGLFVFSPITLFGLYGLPQLLRSHWRAPIVWTTMAGIVQFGLYASYTVWWGGHTYGPRYLLDVLPLSIPLGIAAMHRVGGSAESPFATVALAWSVFVAALGAFNYPAGDWNTSPAEVDRHHERLWDWHDSQIARTWHAGPSPQNFSLFTRTAYRVPRP